MYIHDENIQDMRQNNPNYSANKYDRHRGQWKHVLELWYGYNYILSCTCYI